MGRWIVVVAKKYNVLKWLQWGTGVDQFAVVV